MEELTHNGSSASETPLSIHHLNIKYRNTLTYSHAFHTHTQLAISNKLLNFYKIELKMISKNLIKKA